MKSGSAGSNTSPSSATAPPSPECVHSGCIHYPGAMTAGPPSMPADFDAIVVGSGMTGGWAAKELTELGLRTLVLEAGRPIIPEQDYVEHKPPWEEPVRGLGER